MQVLLTGPLRAIADDQSSIEVEARTIRELFGRLKTRYSGFEAALDNGVAVAINGEIYRDAWSTEIPVDAEVVLLPRIQGG